MPRLVAQILQRQDGVIERHQALGAGMPLAQVEVLLKRGRWVRLIPRVYLESSFPPTPRQVIRAVHLWAGSSSVITGDAALFWQRLRPDPPRAIDVAVTHHRRSAEVRGSSTPITITTHRQPIPDEYRLRSDGIWTVRPQHAVYALLPVEGPGLLDDAIRQRWVTLPMIKEVQRISRRARGDVTRAEILAAATTGAISEGERLLHRILRSAGITGWKANSTIVLQHGTKVGDVVFEKVRLVIEVDGFAFHSEHGRFQDDRSRQNLLVRSDWTVLRLTWWQLTDDPEGVVEVIKDTISMLECRLHGSQS